jgi:ferredoxin
MSVFRHALIVALSLALGAHYLRWGQPGAALVCALSPVLLVARRRWCAQVVSLFLLVGAVVWFQTADAIVARRLALGAPWMRTAAILGALSLLCVLGAALLHTANARARSGAAPRTAAASTAAFVLVFVLCGLLQARLRDPVPLLLERIWPGFGWLQVFALAVYAAVVAEWLVGARSTAVIRSRLWLLFSIVFFAQLTLGLLGVEMLLMTGKLHLPVPAVILAGPLYRGEGLFMAILFLATVAIVGPAWCSWLCYVGAWDNLAASARRPRPGTRHYAGLRLALFAMVVAAAVGLRRLGIGGVEAAWLGVAFGLVGVGLMATASRRLGIMVHCTSYCPIGLAADLIGRLNPFRVRIGPGCNECRACSASCRYAALNIEHLRRRRPGITCTLCGDCLAVCDRNQIHYRFPDLSAGQARTVFFVLVAVLHAVFLGVARV